MNISLMCDGRLLKQSKTGPPKNILKICIGRSYPYKMTWGLDLWPWTFSGCGNNNRFLTRAECQLTCMRGPPRWKSKEVVESLELLAAWETFWCRTNLRYSLQPGMLYISMYKYYRKKINKNCFSSNDRPTNYQATTRFLEFCCSEYATPPSPPRFWKILRLNFGTLLATSHPGRWGEEGEVPFKDFYSLCDHRISFWPFWAIKGAFQAFLNILRCFCTFSWRF